MANFRKFDDWPMLFEKTINFVSVLVIIYNNFYRISNWVKKK